MSTKIWIDDKMYLVDDEVREAYDALQERIEHLEEGLKTMMLPPTRGIFTTPEAKNEFIFSQMAEYLNKFTPEDVKILVVDWSSAEHVAQEALKE